MTKRIVALMLVGILLVLGLSSCQTVKKASVQVKITDDKDQVIYEGNVDAVADINKENGPVVGDVILALTTLEDITSVYDKGAYPEEINGIKAQIDSTNTGSYMWTYSLNDDELMAEDSTLKDFANQTIKSGDTIVIHFIYEAFPVDEVSREED